MKKFIFIILLISYMYASQADCRTGAEYVLDIDEDLVEGFTIVGSSIKPSVTAQKVIPSPIPLKKTTPISGGTAPSFTVPGNRIECRTSTSTVYTPLCFYHCSLINSGCSAVFYYNLAGSPYQCSETGICNCNSLSPTPKISSFYPEVSLWCQSHC
jgi:hypothetical protein